MQVSITGHHIELTEALKEAVNNKLQHLKHSFDHVLDVHVVLSVEKNRQRCEISLQANGINIHASDVNDDMYVSIDSVVSKLNRQMKRYRSKLKSHKGRGRGHAIKVSQLNLSADIEELAEDHSHEVVEHEEVHADSISVDDAVMLMELSENKNVLIFTNIATDQINVICRQQDGTLSWIEPTL
ncbi:MAG: ribosome-associated translation inhibitor RaiA [Zetaproteobacteria bacterium]|nr:ribosome-associated translation inhibitor RaiA [Zetaproteobacteria bacterium]